MRLKRRKRPSPLVLENGDLLVPAKGNTMVRIGPEHEHYAGWQQEAIDRMWRAPWRLFVALLLIGFLWLCLFGIGLHLQVSVT